MEQPAAFKLGEWPTSAPFVPTESAGRAGHKEGRLGPQPGPAGPVRRLIRKGADQNGQ